jgi:pimeloyl-ACP methyl ester carboxylesterase
VIVKLPYRFAPLAAHRQQAIDRAQRVLARTASVDRWAVAGHSKGGKIAAEFVRDDPAAAGALVLIGTSHPRDFDLSRLAIPVKKLFADRDGIATMQTIEATRDKLPPHTQWIEIAGGNHSQFGYYGQQFGDGRATIDRAEQQRRTLAELLATLAEMQKR